MKINDVEFPQALLNEFRDGEVVIFAGAGVSIGPPANLYMFDRLAELIAQGTGQVCDSNKETPDRFLGRLRDDDVHVHALAAQNLQKNNPQPKELHRDLLRIFRRRQDVRVVTTNFDLLFERAAEDVFGQPPKLYSGPALPIGNKFRGIVHLHGSLDEPDEMVLTHQDFGRAYLTEADGWARLFLIDLFNECTVLFVGYSHRDTIMTYLTPSLPPLDEQRRFALIGDSEDADYWKRMGIEPILFPQQDTGDFVSLDRAVARLANLMRQGTLGWRTDITAIARRLPPIDDQSVGIIDQALSNREHARFFADAAHSSDWIEWLDNREHLNRLFDEVALAEPDKILCSWLTQNFATTHTEAVFSVIERHEGKLNSYTWNQLARQLRMSDETELDPQTVSQWVHYLMRSVPSKVEYFVLGWLAETCAELGLFQNLLQVFDAMTAFRYRVRPGFERDTRGIREHHVRMLRQRCIEPHLERIALPLLERITMRLEERRSAILAWNGGDDSRDADSGWRLAINPKSPEKMPREIDHVIDFARICLDWLAMETPEVVAQWIKRHVNSGAPLLRRLAIYAASRRVDTCAGEKLSWLLETCDINDVSGRHEIIELVIGSYPSANEGQRSAFIQAVFDYQVESSENFDNDARSAYYRLIWYDRLCAADPNCDLAKKAFGDVRAEHPDFPAQEDVASGGPTPYKGFLKSRWTEEELLAKSGQEWLSDLLTYEPTPEERFYEGFDRPPTLTTISQAAVSDPQWGFGLAKAMTEDNNWESDLWPCLLSAWARAELESDTLRTVLDFLERSELQERQPYVMTHVLLHLVQGNIVLDSLDFLLRANDITKVLGGYADDAGSPGTEVLLDGVAQKMNWLERGDQHLGGSLAWYWVHSIVCLNKLRPQSPPSITDDYRNALNAIMDDDRMEGKLGRAVLASQLHFLLEVDGAWAEDKLLPLFGVGHEDFQLAWEGFVDSGRWTPTVGERLRTALDDALPRILDVFDGTLIANFVEFYVEALCTSPSDAMDRRIINFFQHADAQSRLLFANEIGYRLSNLDETAQVEWWSVWLKDYWQNRINGKPKRLDDEEIERMFEWVLHLTGVFPDAVCLATTMRQVPLQRTWMFPGVIEGSLADRYPEALAQFLIDLSNREPDPLFWQGTKITVDKLLGSGLQPKLAEELRELEAKYQLEG